MNTPKVSVIVPAYNRSNYISRCLRSLLWQTEDVRSYEIIVIDDGSKDDTSRIVKLFMSPKDNQIHLIENNENLGLPASINKGIRAAKGEYIIRVDSDDYVNKHFISCLLYALESNEHYDAVACDYILVDDTEQHIQRCSSADDAIACGIIFKKKQLFEIGLYNEDFRANEEKEMRTRFDERYNLLHLPLPLYRYRRHEDNMTNNEQLMQKYVV